MRPMRRRMLSYAFPVDAAGNRQDSSAYRYMRARSSSTRRLLASTTTSLEVRVSWVRASIVSHEIRCVGGPSLRVRSTKEDDEVCEIFASLRRLFIIVAIALVPSGLIVWLSRRRNLKVQETPWPGDLSIGPLRLSSNLAIMAFEGYCNPRR